MEVRIDEMCKKLYDEYAPYYSLIDGYVVGYKHAELKEIIDNFVVQDSDVWITTYPKSGTTWTQEMVWLILNDFNYEDGNRPLFEKSAFFEVETLCEFGLRIKDGHDIPTYVYHSIDHAKNDKSPNRCIKTHLGWELLPNEIKAKKKHPKIIHVLRNPKDACVSYYYHHLTLEGYTGTFEEFKTLFLNDKVIFSPYWKMVNSYWQRRNDPNILIIRYEDMKKDLRSIINQVATFLNKYVPDDQMETLLKHLSFESMQNNPHLNLKPREDDNDPTNNVKFIRKGIVGDHKNIMSAEVIAEFDRWIAKNNTLAIPI